MLVDIQRETFKRDIAELANSGFDELTVMLAFLRDIMGRNDRGRI